VTPAMPNLKKKLFRSVSLVHAKTCAKFLVNSFIRSKDITPNRMRVFACKMPEMHPKIVFWGFRVGKFDTSMLIESNLQRNTSFGAKRTAICLSVCSLELGKKSPKNKKTYHKLLNIIFHPFAGGSLLADCSKFLLVGWHPRRYHAYQILSRSRRELRSYGGPKSGFSYSFSNRSYNSVSHYRATL